MEWTMEWSDGMNWWNGISANQNGQNSHHGRGEVVSAVSPLLTSTGLLRLASVFYPRSQAHAWNIQLVDNARFWQCGCQMMCALIGMSLKLAAPNFGPAFGWSCVKLHVTGDECVLVDTIWVCPGFESQTGVWFWRVSLHYLRVHLRWSRQIKCELTNYT